MIDFFFKNDFLLIKATLCFVWAALLTYVAIPAIIRVSLRKNLVDTPVERSSHLRKVPNLGGIAIFFSLLIVSSIFIPEIGQEYVFFYACLVILFFIGFLDDILVVRARVKLYAQIITSAMIVIGSEVRIDNFYGILGIYEIPYILSIVFSIFVFIILINAFNLIDGIDGLASIISIIALLTFSYIFYSIEDYPMFLLSVTSIGSILIFLYFNLSDRLKIFMGDTGSMVVGFLITFMLIHFINKGYNTSMGQNVAPVLAVAIFIIPIIDTMSVLFIRLLEFKNPLAPDKNHLHHRFLRLGFNHIQTSILISSINIIILIVAFSFRDLSINFFLLTILVIAFSLSYLPLLIYYSTRQSKIRE